MKNQKQNQWPKIEVRSWDTRSHSYKTRIVERSTAETLLLGLMRRSTSKESRKYATQEHTTRTFDQLAAGSIVGVQPLGSETHFRLYTLWDSKRDAAPEMFDALQDIVRQFEKTRLMVGADLADSIRVFGKQAIAKAERRAV